MSKYAYFLHKTRDDEYLINVDLNQLVVYNDYEYDYYSQIQFEPDKYNMVKVIEFYE